MASAAPHVLQNLRVPARYEKLHEAIGSDVVKLLTHPQGSIDALELLALSSIKTQEGMLVPVFGQTGAGKTTLAENLDFFLPERFTATVTHDGPVTFDALRKTVDEFRQRVSPAPTKTIPINIDHREGAPPSDEELSALKRFLRTYQLPTLVLWLETDQKRATEIATRYRGITGTAIVDLPLSVEGPDRSTWQSVALSTIELCNPIPASQLADLGIDPRDYNLSLSPSLGEFLKRLAIDFARLVHSHQVATKRPVSLLVVFASEALDRGTLPSFTQGGEAGLLDSHALLKCTPDSMIGQKWSAKRGVLTQAIFRLDARVFWMPPAALVAALRRHGPPEVQDMLERAGRTNPSPADLSVYLGRTDLGRHLAQVKGAAYETRGRPAEEARDMVASVAKDFGYGRGNDKKLNASLLQGWVEYVRSIGIDPVAAKAEQALDFCPGIIPDNQIDLGDRVLCIEYVWRTGNVLDSSRRSEAAQYALDKVHNYAVNLGWTNA